MCLNKNHLSYSQLHHQAIESVVIDETFTPLGPMSFLFMGKTIVIQERSGMAPHILVQCLVNKRPVWIPLLNEIHHGLINNPFLGII